MKTARIVVSGLILIGSTSLSAQVSDDFSDGNFSHNPHWEGDSSHFEVNAAHQLHLRWAGSDTSLLVTPNGRLADTEWNFWVKLSFNASENNFLRIYLASGSKELNQPLHGYLLQAGGEQDSLVVMRQTGSVLTSLFRFPDATTAQSVNLFRVRITRDTVGWWKGWIDCTGGTDFVEQGSWFDPMEPEVAWFGFWCKYTSSNSTKFYMDDLYVGPVKQDTLPPRLVALSASDPVHLQLVFSEALSPVEATRPSNYWLTGHFCHPQEATLLSGHPDRVQLTFSDLFPEQFSDTLLITRLTDLSGNILSDTLAAFSRFTPGAYDIVINEVMFDPDPRVGLPPAEYIELYNRTAFQADLNGWSVDAGASRTYLPPVMIQPHGYLLLTGDSSLVEFGPFCSVFTASSTLSNAGAQLVLRNEKRQVVHQVAYSPDWITESWKQEGGWSLELVDPGNPCGCEGNWEASRDPSGGSPGSINSVFRSNPDVGGPEALRSFLWDGHTWAIRFSESLDSTSFGAPAAWRLLPGGLHPDSLIPVSPDYRLLRLVFPVPFEAGTVYSLSGPPGILDCAGNEAGLPVESQAGIPEPTGYEDVVINEVLPDPWPGGSRFIELFNRSEKLVDLRDLAVAVSDTGSASGHPTIVPLPEEPYLMFPLDFAALCSGRKAITSFYHTPDPGRLIELNPFPQMKNESGSVRLIRSCDEELIDGMEYFSGMQFPLLSTSEGVSLERISPERPSNDPDNWHSASGQSGYATPAYENSQWRASGSGEEELIVSPPIFSPDNDGYEDVVSIAFSLDEPGYRATILIYDASGRLVRHLVPGTLCGTRNEFTWDGIRDDRTKALLGIYVVYLELVHPAGRVKRYRKPLVVGGCL